MDSPPLTSSAPRVWPWLPSSKAPDLLALLDNYSFLFSPSFSVSRNPAGTSVNKQYFIKGPLSSADCFPVEILMMTAIPDGDPEGWTVDGKRAKVRWMEAHMLLPGRRFRPQGASGQTREREGGSQATSGPRPAEPFRGGKLVVLAPAVGLPLGECPDS